ncbi:TonB-dependent receptor [Thermosulfurimonas dismutans]|uniref:TonB-dependent receptor n=1 Tax=Thermosulfurimonas dismutans TaxID=999894 RepID=A0A179D1X0_9BACT|nr:TonB-dependent receptor [Thermosulfurimonas dismutans]OAQ20056.1 TonB-dependent receptor [Thermosulfurimonas dismutans]
MLTRLGLLILILVAMGSAWAEEEEVPEVVVTATRVPQAVSEAPAAVSVITRKDMEKKNLQTLDEALKHEAGVFVHRRKGLMDTIASVELRGLPRQGRTLVLLDGIPVNDGYSNSVRWATLSLDEVERVEVVRGPFSSLWGGNAMGGVINILTRLPEKFTFSATGGLGEDVTRRWRISMGDRVGRLAFLAGYEEDRTEGYPTVPVLKSPKTGTGTLIGGYPTTDPTGEKLRWVVGDKGDQRGERWNYHLKIGIDVRDEGEVRLGFQHGVQRYDYGHPHTYLTDPAGKPAFSGTVSIPGGLAASVSPYDFISYAGLGDYQTSIVSLNYRDVFGKLETEFNFGFLRRDGYYTKPYRGGDYYTASGEKNESDSETYYLDVKGNLPLGESHLLTAGLTLRRDWSNVESHKLVFYRDEDSEEEKLYLSRGKSRALGLFVQDIWTVREDLSLYLGLRYDHWWTYDGKAGDVGAVEGYDDRDDGAFSPKAALVWRPDGSTNLRLSVGKAFRPPNLYELYRTWSWYGRTYRSNPDLDPETSWTVEVGGERWWFGKRLRLSASLFRTWMEDFIYRAYYSDTKEYIWTNSGEGEILGFEGELELKPFSWLSAKVNYTRNDTKITDNPAKPESEGKRFVGVPPWIWNFELSANPPLPGNLPGLKFSIFGHYVGKVFRYDDNSDKAEGVYGTSEEYFVADVKVSLTWHKATLSFSVNNVFDEDYYDYYQAPGRTWFAELKFEY